MSKTKQLYACFVDFRKAYDSVWREGLLFKLLKMNIRGKVFNIIEDMLSNVLSTIKIHNNVSESFKTTNGVKQGDILSPLLFNLFINDLPDALGINEYTPSLDTKKINCLMYADDLVILSEDPRGLQHSLNNLDEYCSTWKLDVNLNETKVLKFQQNGLTLNFLYSNYLC